MTQTVLYPANPLNERQVDPEFAAEWAALQFAGVQRALVTPNLESAVANGEQLFRNLPGDGGPVVYRGWMLSLQEIALLDVHLRAKGCVLVTSAANYIKAHHLVNWADTFAGLTPKTVFVHPEANDAEIVAAGERLNAEAFVVKDWVKSRKHEWATAAYAPNLQALPAVVREFVRLQGEFLVGQVALREFVELEPEVGEQRTWWVNGELVLATGHPDSPTGAVPVGDEFFAKLERAVQRLGAPFVTVDIAQRAGGEAIVIEVGDAQVSGLPGSFDADLYATMIQRVLAL